MPWVQCSKCQYIREAKFPAYHLNTIPIHPGSKVLPEYSMCTNCGEQKKWTEHTGLIAQTILSNERLEYELAYNLLTQKRKSISDIRILIKTKEKSYAEQFKEKFKESTFKYNPNDSFHLHTEIQLCIDTLVSLMEEEAILNKKLSQMTDPDIIERDATIVNKKAFDASPKGLILGSRQFVSMKAPITQILDAANWSWGLNVSWVEGGITGKTIFELLVESSNPYHNIPNDILVTLQQTPNIQSDVFLSLCETHGAGSLLWYNQGGENRPTWTALEIATLLRMNYNFLFQNNKIYLKK